MRNNGEEEGCVLEARDGQPVAGHSNSVLHVHGALASLLLENLAGCTVRLHCAPQQVRLARCRDCSLVIEHPEGASMAAALEACSGIVFSGNGWRRPIHDFTPRRDGPNYSIDGQ